jgi:hypothetical protein
MRSIFSALIAGIVFGGGLALSDMINPGRVLAFLDVAGAWDPTLAFVMAGAVIPTGIAFAMRRRLPRHYAHVSYRKIAAGPPADPRRRFRRQLGTCRLLPRARDCGARARSVAALVVRADHARNAIERLRPLANLGPIAPRQSMKFQTDAIRLIGADLSCSANHQHISS